MTSVAKRNLMKTLNVMLSLKSVREYIIGPDGSVGIATVYGLDVPWIESRWGGKIFRTLPDRRWGLPSFLYNIYRVVPRGGVKRPERGVNHTFQSSAEIKERVELYFYSTTGSSWPVIG